MMRNLLRYKLLKLQFFFRSFVFSQDWKKKIQNLGIFAYKPILAETGRNLGWDGMGGFLILVCLLVREILAVPIGT